MFFSYNKVLDKKCITNKLNGAGVGASVLILVFQKVKKTSILCLNDLCDVTVFTVHSPQELAKWQ